VATGYRSGNYAGGATFGSLPVVVNPEKLLAYEVGYKSTWLDNRISLDAATYYYDYNDIQLTVNQVVNGVFTSILANAGKGYVKGVELEARARITEDLTFHGNVSGLRTDYTQLVTGGVSYSGYNFARVPDLTGLAALDYVVPLPAGQVRFGTDWAYSSKLNFNITNNTDPYTLQDGYWLGALRANYDFLNGKESIGAYVGNVTNKDYKVQAMLYSNGYYPTRLGDPRMFGVTFTAHF
jgi:iron complex outermembrane receptor protein